MQKVLKTAALIAGLAAVSCSNAALREGSASQAARVGAPKLYRVSNAVPGALYSNTVSFWATDYLTPEGACPTLILSKDLEQHVESLLRVVGVAARKWEYSSSESGGYYTKDGELLFAWSRCRPDSYTGDKYALCLSTKYYKVELSSEWFRP